MANAKEDALEQELLECIALWEQLNRIAVCYREESSSHGPVALREAIADLVRAYRQLRETSHKLRSQAQSEKASAGDSIGADSWRVPLELLQWLDRGENPDLFLLRLLYDAVDLEHIGTEKERVLVSFRTALEETDTAPDSSVSGVQQQPSSSAAPVPEEPR